MRRTKKAATIAIVSAMLGGHGVLTGTPAGADTGSSSAQTTCKSEFVGLSPVRLAIPSFGMNWTNAETRVTKDPVGYRMLITRTDGRGSRLQLAHFDDAGELLSHQWIAGKREANKMVLVDFGFDHEGRAVAAWAGDRLTIARFTYDGALDTNFSDNGKLDRSIPDLFDRNTSVTWTESGVTVLISDSNDRLSEPGLTYRFSHDGSELVGGEATQAANKAYPFANWSWSRSYQDGPYDVGRQMAVTAEGQLIYQNGGSIVREHATGETDEGWGNSGVRATANTERMFGQWHYDDDEDALSYLTWLANDRSIFTRLPADGGDPIEQIEIDSQPWSIARFGDGTMIGLVGEYTEDRELVNLRSGHVIDRPHGELVSHLTEINPDLIGLSYSSGFGVFDEDGSSAVFYMAPPRVTDGSPGGLTHEALRVMASLGYDSPSVDEVNRWRHYLAAGNSAEAMAGQLALGSPMINLSNQADNWNFVQFTYELLLGREPEPQMAGFWQYELDTGRPRTDLVAAIATSQEFAERTNTHAAYQQADEGALHRLYAAYFGRSADLDGLCYWLNLLRTQPALDAGIVSDEFAASREFQLTYGHLSDGEFVNLVYWNVMGRTPDAGGQSYWTQLLDQGLTRGQLMLNFSDSPEFVLRTDTAR